MDSDQISKLVLTFAVAFAIVLIAVGLFRILNNLAGSVRDFRKSIQNISSASDAMLEDYNAIRSSVKGLIASMDGVKSFLAPFSAVTKLTNLFNRRGNSRDSVKDANKSNQT